MWLVIHVGLMKEITISRLNQPWSVCCEYMEPLPCALAWYPLIIIKPLQFTGRSNTRRFPPWWPRRKSTGIRSSSELSMGIWSPSELKWLDFMITQKCNNQGTGKQSYQCYSMWLVIHVCSVWCDYMEPLPAVPAWYPLITVKPLQFTGRSGTCRFTPWVYGYLVSKRGKMSG